MSLGALLPWIQIILSVLIMGAVLLQQSDASLGGAFGGAQAGNPFRTKRGAEKNLFIATIVLGVLLVAATLLSSYLQVH